MKTILILLITGLSLHFFVSKPIDYRDVYCGNYTCKRIHKYLSSGSIHMDTTNFIVVVSKNTRDSILNIETSENLFAGKLANGKIINSHYHSIFSNDSIYFTFIPSLGPTFYKYVGKK